MKIANAEYYDDLENLVTTDEARVLNKNRKIDSSSSGLILADQTGIGKGRTVASIIRWAVLQGKVAIFITQRETLFTDMVRDLQDINFANHPIFVINTNIIKVDGKDISSNKNENKYKGEKIIFTTYFQIQGKPNWKHEILRKLSHGAILVLDEAHEAAASVNTQTEARGKREKVSNRYLFFSSIFRNISGVLFSSATYAKRPSNLMLYYPFTDINNYPYDKLLSMLAETGSIGQSLVSNALVESGQLLRRESSFKGILFNDYLTPDLIKKVHGDEKKEQDEYQFIANSWDKIAEILADIVKFENTFKFQAMNIINKGLKEEGGYIGGHAVLDSDSTKFTSIMHNSIKSFDLSLKAKAIADYAIKLVKEGQKVLIYLHFTNTAFFTENFAMGEKVDDNIGLVLKRNWKRALEYTVKNNSTGETFKRTIPLSILEQVPNGYEFYTEIGKKISQANINVPLSAIDYFHYALNKVGIKTLEITGRNEKVDYSEGKILAHRKKDKTHTVSDLFNNTTDHNVIIFNSSGATGISLHSSEKYKARNKRHMIVAQPSDDINTYMQAFGRINRTGQTVLPEYTFVSLPIPVSNRMRIVLRKKLNSLNANVKGSSKDESSMKDIIDMANPFGDEVVFDYLEGAFATDDEAKEEIERLNTILDNPTAATKSYNAFLKTTGRLPILSIRDQENFYDQITDKYLGYLEDMKRQGQTLQEESMDLQAKTISSKVLFARTGDNIFQQECLLETVEIKTEHIQVQDVFDELNFDKSNEILEKAEKDIEAYIAQKKQLARLNNKEFELSKDQNFTINRFKMYLERFAVGSFHYYTQIENADAIDKEEMFVVDIRYTPRENSFPCSLSYLKVDFISAANITGELRTTVLMSQTALLDKIKVMNVKRNAADYYLRQIQKNIEQINNQREIITGNLITGLTIMGNQGKYTTYTTHDGKKKIGILVNSKNKVIVRTYDIDSIYKMLIDNKEIVNFQNIRLFYRQTDQDFINSNPVYFNDKTKSELKELVEGYMTMTVPRSRKSGGVFFTDKNLIEMGLDEQGFISPNENSGFSARFHTKKIKQVLEYLQNELNVKFQIVMTEKELLKEKKK